MTIATEYQVELKKKDARIADLEDEVMRLKISGGANPHLVNRFKISFGAARILEVLSTGRIYSIEQLADFVCKDDTRPSTITTRLVALRRAIAPIEIRNIHGCGYCLAGDCLEAIRAIMRGE